MKKFTLKAFTSNTNANGLDNSIALYIEHPHKYAIAEFVVCEGITTPKQFANTDFTFYSELSVSKQEAIIQLQKRLKRMMKGKSSAVKVKAKKVAKKAVAKKQTKKQSIKEKLFNQYKVVTQYSENLMQDVYSVVYRTKELKRFINENLCNKYIEQEVLLKMNEKAVKEPTKIKGITKELKAEFEIA